MTHALPTIGHEWHLVGRPRGWPTPTDFALREAAVARPGPGQALVYDLYFSVDPYMRRRMDDVESYVPPFQLDQPMDGGERGRGPADPGRYAVMKLVVEITFGMWLFSGYMAGKGIWVVFKAGAQRVRDLIG
jgi:NADPH-dependent curcumin reductase CurA